MLLWLENPGILSELARYYDLTGEPETAVGFLEKAIEAHNYQTNYSLDDEYFDISGELAALYEAHCVNCPRSRSMSTLYALKSSLSRYSEAS